MDGDNRRLATVTAGAGQTAEDAFQFSVATAPATARHRQLALAVALATLAAYAVVIPHAGVPLPRIDSFIPSVFAAIFVADLVAATLLYAQFSISGSRPLLVLAIGYFFSSLIVVGHVLTFPGAFAPTGLLGAGPQSAAWLHILWRLGFGASIVLYSLLRSDEKTTNLAEPWPAIAWSVVVVTVVVCALIYAATAGHEFFPALLSNSKLTPLGISVNGFLILLHLAALALLVARTRGRTILDLWIIVVAFALLAESVMITFFVVQRFTFGYYAIRLIGLPISQVVLVVLLWETLRLYGNLASANSELRRERANRLNNAAAGLAAVAHEIRQSLTGINLMASAGRKMLDRPSPEIGEAKLFLGEIQDAATKAGETFVGIIGLFKGGDDDREAADVNAVILEATRLLRQKLEDHEVVVRTQLAPDLPSVRALTWQLQAVVSDLVQHSIDTMDSAPDGPRTIDIATARLGSSAISISFQDTGPGIAPEEMAGIFDPFLNTKTKGEGLGLAICKMIVEQHGGRLSAASDIGGGARFEITLPQK